MPSGPLHITKPNPWGKAVLRPSLHHHPRLHLTPGISVHLETGGRATERLRRQPGQKCRYHQGTAALATPRHATGGLRLCDHLRVQEGFWENPFTKTRPKLSPGNPLHGCPSYEDFITKHPNTWE